MRFGVMLFAVVGGCSGFPGDDTRPVDTAPLSGTVGGRPFAAVFSWTHLQDLYKDVTIAAKGGSCSSLPRGGADGESMLDLTVSPWMDGTVFSLEITPQTHAVSMTTWMNGSAVDIDAVDGRVELPSAGSVTMPATLRVRAFHDMDNTVEGQVSVAVCP
jgi:hypothetical protein